MVDTIDPSITARIGTGASNPLTQIGQVVGIQNAMNQNALFQQTYRARAALGPLSQAAVGPDGKMDWDKYAILVSSHPDTAWMAPDILNSIAQRKLVDAQTINEQLKIQGERSDRFGQILMTAANDPRVGNMGDLLSEGYIRQAYANGALDPAKSQEHVAFLADPKYASMRPDEFRQMLGNHGIALRQGAAGMAANAAKFGTIGFDPATGQEISGWTNEYRRSITPQGGGQLNAMPQQAAGGGVTPPNIAYGTPGEAQKKVWGDVEKMREDYNSQDARGQQIQFVSAQLQKMLGQMNAGAGARSYIEAARVLQSLGIGTKTDTDQHKKDKSLVDTLANGSLPAGQTAETLSTTLGTMAVRDLLLSHADNEGSAGRLTNAEFQRIVGIYPNIENDPRANQELFNYMNRQYALRHEKAQAYQEVYNRYHTHQQLPGGMTNPTQFEPYWADHLMRAGVIEGNQ